MNVSMEEAKKNMYAFSTTTYTGFQCTVSEETSEKFKGKWKYQSVINFNNFDLKKLSTKLSTCLPSYFVGLPGVLWVLPDSYIDVKNKDYGGDSFNFPLYIYIYITFYLYEQWRLMNIVFYKVEKKDVIVVCNS